jgi:hypothetical protein
MNHFSLPYIFIFYSIRYQPVFLIKIKKMFIKDKGDEHTKKIANLTGMDNSKRRYK